MRARYIFELTTPGDGDGRVEAELEEVLGRALEAAAKHLQGFDFDLQLVKQREPFGEDE